MDRRIVITGTGMVTAAGIGVDACWSTLLAGASAVRRVSLWDPTGMPSHIAAEVDGWPELPAEVGGLPVAGRPVTFGLSAALEALAEAGISDASALPVPALRRGVFVAGGFDDLMLAMLARGADAAAPEGQHDFEAVDDVALIGGLAQPGVLEEMERYSQVHLMQALARHFGAAQAATVSTACAGGTTALGEAVAAMRRGELDATLVLGVDTLISREMMGGFCNLTALSTRNDQPERASRPFDAERDGFVMGEGAGALMLEWADDAVARGATIVAELAGFGWSGDAYRLTDPQPDGDGMVLSMRRAIDDAGIRPAQVSVISAHGTSTAANDKAETKAIRALFGDHTDALRVHATKATVGHLIHGAGAVATVFAARTANRGVVPPTANYEQPDPACDLPIVAGAPLACDVDGVLVNAFGFGGQNATVVVRRWADGP